MSSFQSSHTNGQTPEEHIFDTADDPEEYSQNERLREIFQIRMEVHRTRIEVRKAAAVGKLSRRNGLNVYASSVVGYALELESLMTKQYPDKGEDYWDNVHLGTIEPAPPEWIFDRPDKLYDVDIRNLSGGEPIPVVGLGELVDLGESVDVTWTYEESGMRSGWDEEEAATSVPIPMDVLDAAYRQANLFLADIGMDLEPNVNHESGVQ